MLKVCPYKCKESSDLNFGGKLKAIHSAYLIINIVWYFQRKCDIDILTIFWKWQDNCITIYHQTIFWGLISTSRDMGALRHHVKIVAFIHCPRINHFLRSTKAWPLRGIVTSFTSTVCWKERPKPEKSESIIEVSFMSVEKTSQGSGQSDTSAPK